MDEKYETNWFLLEAPNIFQNHLHCQWWHGKERSSVGVNPGSRCQRRGLRNGKQVVSVQRKQAGCLAPSRCIPQQHVQVCGCRETPCLSPEFPRLLSTWEFSCCSVYLPSTRLSHRDCCRRLSFVHERMCMHKMGWKVGRENMTIEQGRNCASFPSPCVQTSAAPGVYALLSSLIPHVCKQSLQAVGLWPTQWSRFMLAAAHGALKHYATDFLEICNQSAIFYTLY